MIRIIERGTIKIKQCKNCWCLFSYEKEDIEHNTHSDFREYNYYYIICPQCKEEIRLGGIRK